MCGCRKHFNLNEECTCQCEAWGHGGHLRAEETVAEQATPGLLITFHRMLDNAGVSVAGTVEERLQSLIAMHVDAEVKEPGEGGGREVGSPSPEALKIALTNWWIDLANEEVDRVVPKAVEYGSTDLMEVGRTLAQTMGRHGLSDEEHTELGIFFYLAGKLARWTDAIKTGRRPSDDTLHDIGVYVRMAQRTRAVGGWPVGPDESP